MLRNSLRTTQSEQERLKLNQFCRDEKLFLRIVQVGPGIPKLGIGGLDRLDLEKYSSLNLSDKDFLACLV